MNALKRKLKSAEDAINNFNLHKSSESIVIDKNKIFTGESRKVKMSDLLEKIPLKVKTQSSESSFVEYSLTRPSGNKFKTVRLKDIKFQELFEKKNFMANLNHVFNADIDEKNFKVNLFSKLNFKIVIDVPRIQSEINVQEEDKSEFMFLVCMIFGMLFNITIDKCICHPCSFQDFMLLDAGITKNFISNECSTHILGDPFLFDPLIHYDCAHKSNFNSLFIGLNLLSPQNISVNVTSKQIIQEK